MRVDFYHLEKTPLDNVLPILLEKAYESDQKVLIKVDIAERADYLNTLLWTYKPDSFLPHGVEKDGNAESQPILITHKDNYNPNKATLVVLLDNIPIPMEDGFVRALYFFDGRNPDSLQKHVKNGNVFRMLVLTDFTGNKMKLENGKIKYNYFFQTLPPESGNSTPVVVG